MRDPARIERMLAKLRELWHRNPDLRLGQLIVNLSYPSGPFQVEDDIIETAIDESRLEG